MYVIEHDEFKWLSVLFLFISIVMTISMVSLTAYLDISEQEKYDKAKSAIDTRIENMKKK